MKMVCWGVLLVSVTTATAGMPGELKGRWVIAPKATAAHMRTSPKWKVQDEKYLQKALERMMVAVYEIDDDALTMSIRRSKRTLPIVWKESEGKKHILEAKAGDKTVVLTMTINAEGLLNMRSSATDDMDYYLWQRAPAGTGGEEKPDVVDPRPGLNGTVTGIDKKHRMISLREREGKVSDRTRDESKAPIRVLRYNEKTLFRKIEMKQPGKGVGAAVGVDELKVGDYVNIRYEIENGKKVARGVFWRGRGKGLGVRR